MFKFMKSKKGFSLVELMIVVVIMAILVAVAVPIFNSVTGSSRAKTCIDNQRSIVSTLNTALLEKNITATSAQTFYVVNYKTGNIKGYYEGDVTVSNGAASGGAAIADAATGKIFNAGELKKLFQAPPYCPVDNSAIKVVIQGVVSGDGVVANITTECMTNNKTALGTDKDAHNLT